MVLEKKISVKSIMPHIAGQYEATFFGYFNIEELKKLLKRVDSTDSITVRFKPISKVVK